MAKSKTKKTVYTCQSCGAQRPRWEGRCPECGAWNSFVEETYVDTPAARGSGGGSRAKSWVGQTAAIVPLDQSQSEMSLKRHTTKIEEFDRVLGGGLVEGSLVLLGGAPGIGKSTLLLQMAFGLAEQGLKIIYVSGEESLAQISARAERLDVKHSSIFLCSENNVEEITDLSRKEKPDVVIVDSIQTIFLPSLESAPGSVAQVRESTGHLLNLAKQDGPAVLLIGHITKEGSIAGPKVLEHMVDCVLSFEGESQTQYRLLRSLKNRFGPVFELGIFSMEGTGLHGVDNPSALFVGEEDEDRLGSSIFVSLEGTRPLMCEIQALSVSSPLPSPRRTALGVEIQRLHVLTAVLDRHLGLPFSNHDIYVTVVGGLKIVEPSCDLSIVAALISNEMGQPLPSRSVFLGEVGLTGEVRPVSFLEVRLKEAFKRGYKKAYVPYGNKKGLEDHGLPGQLKVEYVKNVREFYQLIGGSLWKQTKKP